MKQFTDFCFIKRQSTMRTLLMVLMIHTMCKAVTAASSNGRNTNSNQFRSHVTLAGAKKVAFEDTQSALQNFKNFIEEMFIKASDNTIHITNKNPQNVIHQDQVNVLNSEDMDWGGLNDLPLCSKQTITNSTMCIETESREINSTQRFSGNTTFLKAKRRQRPTRELEPVLERQRRRSVKSKKNTKSLKSKKNTKSLKSKKNTKSLSTTKPKRKSLLERLVAFRKKTEKRKKEIADLKSDENVNRLHGFPEQLKEQKKRIKNHKKLYSQLDKYHRCNKNKVKWSKQPWKTLKLFYRAAGQHARLPCNIW